MARYDDEDWEAEIAERRRVRRAIEQRRRRTYIRRRLTALTALAVVVAAPFVLFGGDRQNHAVAAEAGVAPVPRTTAHVAVAHSLASVAHAHAHHAPTVTGFHSGVPILFYHVIHAAPPGAPNAGLYVPHREFDHQLNWLDRHGFEAVTLDQVFAAWNQGAPIPAKPVVISFDDGYATQYRNAAPALAKHGWPGVLNLKVDSILQNELTPDEVKEMIAAGWEIDAHTITHPDVTTLDAAGLKREIGGSRTWLQQHFGVPVNFFCYPSGAYNDAAIAEVKADGYLGATTTAEGLAEPDAPDTLGRVRIELGDGEKGLEEKLVGAGVKL